MSGLIIVYNITQSLRFNIKFSCDFKEPSFLNSLLHSLYSEQNLSFLNIFFMCDT